MDEKRLLGVLHDLRGLSKETEWVEFKENNEDPKEIGEYLSALSNSAALLGKDVAWIVWGLRDETHEVVGTTFHPRQKRVGNEELENWLHRLLSPRIDFRIHELEVEGRRVVLMEIHPAPGTPVRFFGDEYIRIGSYKKLLRDFPEKERALWAMFTASSFEERIAARDVDGQRVLALLDYPGCFRLLHLPMPEGRTGILNQLVKENLIELVGTDAYDIKNIAAILFAYRLEEFPTLDRKRMRVIEYAGSHRPDGVFHIAVSRSGHSRRFTVTPRGLSPTR